MFTSDFQSFQELFCHSVGSVLQHKMEWNGIELPQNILLFFSNSHFSGRISLAIIFFCFKILKLNLLETEGWRTCTCMLMWGESEFTAAKTSTAEQPTESALIDLDVI